MIAVFLTRLDVTFMVDGVKKLISVSVIPTLFVVKKLTLRVFIWMKTNNYSKFLNTDDS